MIDPTTLSDLELRALLEAVSGELSRRSAVDRAPAQIDQALRVSAEAEGATEGGPWQQTTLGYPEGFTVTHSGRTYRSLIRANVWEPGNTADPQYYRWWEDITPEPVPDPGIVPAWDGAGVAYAVDDRVLYEGNEYRCLQAHTSQPGWTPPATPSLWTPA